MLLPNLCLGSERENQIAPTRGRKNSHVWEKVFPHVPPFHRPLWVRSFISVIVPVERLTFSELFLHIMSQSDLKSDRTDSQLYFLGLQPSEIP